MTITIQRRRGRRKNRIAESATAIELENTALGWHWYRLFNVPHNTNVNVNKCIAANIHIIRHRFGRERTRVVDSRGAANKHSYKWNEQQLTEFWQRVGSNVDRRMLYCLFSLLSLSLCLWTVCTVHGCDSVVRYAGRRITGPILWRISLVSFQNRRVDIVPSSYFWFVLFQFKYVILRELESRAIAYSIATEHCPMNNMECTICALQ